MGRNNYINGQLKVILSEQRHCFIGDDGNYSYGICIRNADSHLVYSCETGKRQNPTSSVYIGDHVWIGQDSLVLKGTQIDSGSIIGGMSVLAGKHIAHNESWAGNPARKIADRVFWDGACVHSWTEEQTRISSDYSDYIHKYERGCKKDQWIYDYSQVESLEYSDLDRRINEAPSSQGKCDFLLLLHKTKMKNRFAHSPLWQS